MRGTSEHAKPSVTGLNDSLYTAPCGRIGWSRFHRTMCRVTSGARLGMRADRQLGRARIARFAASLAALALLGFCAAAPASADVSFTRAWGWGVADGSSQFETCTIACQGGISGSGAGQLSFPEGVAVDGSGDVFVADSSNNRVDEYTSAGAFVRSWGWGVLDGASQLETCTTTCQEGLWGGGAGQLYAPSGVAVDGSGDVFVASYNDRVQEFSSSGAFIKTVGSPGSGAGELVGPWSVAVDGSGDVFVADTGNYRVDEFSSSGAFIKAWGWGVADGQSQLETCTSTCEIGIGGGGAGQLDQPYGIAVDRSGDVFVGDCGCTGSPDFGNNRVDEFSSSGAFTKAWGWGVADGQYQFETCTVACQSGWRGSGAGQVNGPFGVAVDGSGRVFVTGGDRVDEFSSAGAFIEAWGWGVVDGADQFETCTTTCEVGGSRGGQLDGVYGVAVDGSGDVFVPSAAGSQVSEFGPAPNTSPPGGGGSPPGGRSAPPSPPAGGGSGPVAPVNTARPVISGTPRAGTTLSCSVGGWSNPATTFSYRWYRNGTLLAGFTGSTYTLGTLDEGTTIACVVTASNPGGSASAQSKTVKVPVPYVAHCPAATGTMTGTTIGQAQLGMTRARARYLYRQHTNRGKQYEDFFCLTPIGVRVGYASPLLLGTLSRAARASVTGRVVWASTSNPYYSLDGVRPGESITTAAAALHTEPPFHIGLNYWYLARKPGYTAVLKVRGDVVQELGIATNALTATRAAQSVLMHSFY
jgi:hypothetical protein